VFLKSDGACVVASIEGDHEFHAARAMRRRVGCRNLECRPCRGVGGATKAVWKPGGLFQNAATNPPETDAQPNFHAVSLGKRICHGATYLKSQ
jgi:hypothetical protein